MARRFLRFMRGNTIALLALFIALGGTTYAATALPANSVGAKQLKKNAVINAKIKSNAVIGAKVKNNSITGADVLESSLGKVPAAANADNATHATSANTAAPSGAAGGALSGSYPNPSLAPGAVGVSKFGTIPAVRANTKAATTQAISSGSLTTVNFDNESFDTAGLHDNVTNNSRLTAPVAGVYQVTGNVRWQSNSTATRFVGLYTNTAGRIASVWVPAAGGTADTDESITDVFTLAAGDFVHMEVYQDSGGTLSLVKEGTDAPSMSMTWVGPATAGAISGPVRTAAGAKPAAR